MLNPRSLAVLCSLLTSTSFAGSAAAQNSDAGPHSADLDGDGRPELLFLDADGRLMLARGPEAGRFEDLTSSAGLTALEGASCAALLDLDSDGDLDLFAGSALHRVWLNVGKGRFLPASAGVEHDEFDLAVDALDFQGDGLVDLWLHTERGPRLYSNLGAGQFELLDLGVSTPWGSLAGGARDAAVVATSDIHEREAEPADAATRARRRLERWRRRAAANNSAVTTSGGGTAGGPFAAASGPFPGNCTRVIYDFGAGVCIGANSVPTLGELYPLSTSLNVSTSGRVGLGTTTPSAGLHLISNDGFLAAGTFNIGSIPAQGAGARMMWYSGKGAFRVGRVTGTQWDDANVGLHSVAMGYRTIASGSSSFALGDDAQASAPWSGALGNDANASGINSIAIGRSAAAVGDESAALGALSVAGSYRSSAVGAYNVGGGDPVSWIGSDPLFEVGNGTSSFDRSNALTVLKMGRVGIGTATPSVRLHVANASVGATTPPTNTQAVFERDSDNYVQILTPDANESGLIFGNPTDAAAGGIYYNSTAPNGLSFRCDGNSTKAVIDQNGQLGIGTTAPEAPLHVFEGSAGTVAGSANASAVFERSGVNYVQILAPNTSESGVVFGNPADGAAGGMYYNSTAPNGLSFRCNGNSTKAVIDQNGRLGVGTTSPSTVMHIAQAGNPTMRIQDLDAGGPTYHVGIASSDDSLRFSETGVADRMVIERTSGNVGIATSSPGFLLHVNGTAGKPGGGSWSVASDARLKTNVQELDGALAKLLELHGVKYEYKDPAAIHELEGEQTGFLAQEVERVFPQWVETGADGYKRLSIRGFEALTVEALREVQAEAAERAERDAARIASLEAQMAELKALVQASLVRANER